MFVDVPDPNLRHRAHAADCRSGVTLSAAEAIEDGPQPFCRVLHLQEVVQADPKQFELVGGDADERITWL
jgi:hypothetical protein